MAVSTSYRLPGVYSEETISPSTNVVAGGNAVVALIGKTAGFAIASQNSVMVGTDGVELGSGVDVIPDSVTVKRRAGSREFVNGEDFRVVLDGDDGNDSGYAIVMRKIKKLSLDRNSATVQHVFAVAEPAFSVLSQTVSNAGGYVIAGSLTILNVDTGSYYTESMENGSDAGDFSVDYYSGIVIAKDGGELIDDNGANLEIKYLWTTAEPIELKGETGAELMHDFISENGLGDKSCTIVSCIYTDDDGEHAYGDTPGAPNGYEEGVDFVIDYNNGVIKRSASSRIPSFDGSKRNFMYIEFAYCPIRSGESVVISYHYTGADFYKPRIISSYRDAVYYYGEAWYTDDEGDYKKGAIRSELSLGAYIAFQNGMSYCYAVPVDSNAPDAQAWSAAFESITTVEGIDIIVPLTGDSTNLNYGVTHLITMQENQDERCMIVGADGSRSVVGPDGMKEFAAKFGRDDVWVVSPSSFRFRNPVKSVVEPIAGYFMAAAAAGYNSSVPQYMPLTRKVMSGFYSANEFETRLSKEDQCANGLMYVGESNGQLRVLHGHTSSTSSVTNAETNVILTKYFIIKRIRRMFETGYIGNIMSPEVIMGVHAGAQNILINMRENNYLYDFYDLSVEVDRLIPTQLNVSFSYRPTFALNYIYISFSLDSSVDAIEV